MSATNLTKNLKLSQFVASDKPSWLGDVNGDNKKIDDGYGVLAGEISKANDTASSAKSQSDANTQTLTNVNSELEDYGNRITALEAGGGTEQLEQRVNTISTDVEALQTKSNTIEEEISQNGTDITALKGRVDTLEPKVKTNEDGITRLDSSIEGVLASIQSQNSRITSNKNSIDNLNANYSTLPSRISSLENRDDITISSIIFKGVSDSNNLDTLNNPVIAIKRKITESNTVLFVPFCCSHSAGNMKSISTEYQKIFEIITTGTIINRTLISDGESSSKIIGLLTTNGLKRVQLYYLQGSNKIEVFIKGYENFNIDGAIISLPEMSLNN